MTNPVPQDLQDKYKGRTFPAAYPDLVDDLILRSKTLEAALGEARDIAHLLSAREEQIKVEIIAPLRQQLAEAQAQVKPMPNYVTLMIETFGKIASGGYDKEWCVGKAETALAVMRQETSVEPAVEGELLSCPFCGKTDRLTIDNLVDDDDFCIECERCEFGQHAVHTHTGAIIAWNTRASRNPANKENENGVE